MQSLRTTFKEFINNMSILFKGLTGNMGTTITLSGDVIGSGTGAISTRLSNTGVTAGEYTNPTLSVDSKGRVTSIRSGSSTSGSTAGVSTFNGRSGAVQLTLSDVTSVLTSALPVANGGTGTTSYSALITNLLPSQSGNNGKVLSTNGTTVSWITLPTTGSSSSSAIGFVSIKDYGATGNGTGTGDNTALQQAQSASSSVYIPAGTYIVSSAPIFGRCWGPGKVYLNSVSLANQQYIHPRPGPVDVIEAAVFDPPHTNTGLNAGPALQRAIDYAQDNDLWVIFPSNQDYILSTGLIAKAGKSASDTKAYHVFIDFNHCRLRPLASVTGLKIDPRCLYADIATGRAVCKIHVKNVHWDAHWESSKKDTNTMAIQIGKSGYQIMGFGGQNLIENIIVERTNWPDGATCIKVMNAESIAWRGISTWNRFLIENSDGQFTGDMKFNTCVFSASGKAGAGNIPLHLYTTGGSGAGNGKESQVRGINFTDSYIYGSGTKLEAAGQYTQVGDIYFTGTQFDQPNDGTRGLEIITGSSGVNQMFCIHLSDIYFGGYANALYIKNNSSTSSIRSLFLNQLYTTVWGYVGAITSNAANCNFYIDGVQASALKGCSINAGANGDSSTSIIKIVNCRNFIATGNTSVNTSSIPYGITISGQSNGYVVSDNALSVSNTLVLDQANGASKIVNNNINGI